MNERPIGERIIRGAAHTLLGVAELGAIGVFFGNFLLAVGDYMSSISEPMAGTASMAEHIGIVVASAITAVLLETARVKILNGKGLPSLRRRPKA